MDLTRRLLVGIALVFVAVACKENPVEPKAELTKAEAVALIKAATVALGDTTLNREVIHVSDDSTVVRLQCPQGGNARVALSVTSEEAEEELDTIRLAVDARFGPAECGVTADGKRFTLDGGTGFRNQLDLQMWVDERGGWDDPATIGAIITGSITGSVDWRLQDREGSCASDLTLSAVPDASDPDNPPTLRGSYKGTLCGHQAEIDATDLLLVVGTES